jgi:enhancer-of-filamentation protein 1
VPPSYQNQGIYQVPTGHGTPEQDVYQVPPSVQRNIGGTNGPLLSKKVSDELECCSFFYATHCS